MPSKTAVPYMNECVRTLILASARGTNSPSKNATLPSVGAVAPWTPADGCSCAASGLSVSISTLLGQRAGGRCKWRNFAGSIRPGPPPTRCRGVPALASEPSQRDAEDEGDIADVEDAAKEQAPHPQPA